MIKLIKKLYNVDKKLAFTVASKFKYKIVALAPVVEDKKTQATSIKALNDAFIWVRDVFQANGVALNNWKLDISEKEWILNNKFKSTLMDVKKKTPKRNFKGLNIELLGKGDDGVSIVIKPPKSMIRGLFGNAKNLIGLTEKALPMFLKNVVSKDDFNKLLEENARVPKQVRETEVDVYNLGKALVNWNNRRDERKAANIFLKEAPKAPDTIRVAPAVMYRPVIVHKNSLFKLERGEPIKLSKSILSRWFSSRMEAMNFVDREGLSKVNEEVGLVIKDSVSKDAVLLNLGNAVKWLNNMGEKINVDLKYKEYVVDNSKLGKDTITAKDVDVYERAGYKKTDPKVNKWLKIKK